MKLAVLILAAALGAPLAHADTTIYPPSGPVVVVEAAPEPQPQPQPHPHVAPRPAPQPRGQWQQRGQRGQLKQQLVDQFDANGDGRLGPRERRKLLRAVRRLEQRLAAVEERAQRAGQPGQRRGGGMIQRFDRDGDGNLGPGEVPPKVMEKLKRFDRNGDGWISPEERPQRRGPQGPQ